MGDSHRPKSRSAKSEQLASDAQYLGQKHVASDTIVNSSEAPVLGKLAVEEVCELDLIGRTRAVRARVRGACSSVVQTIQLARLLMLQVFLHVSVQARLLHGDARGSCACVLETADIAQTVLHRNFGWDVMSTATHFQSECKSVT